jgi:hypothetical protein
MILTLECPVCAYHTDYDDETVKEPGQIIVEPCGECERLYPYPLLNATLKEGKYRVKLRNNDLLYFTRAKLQSEFSSEWLRLDLDPDHHNMYGLKRAYIRIQDIVWAYNAAALPLRRTYTGRGSRAAAPRRRTGLSFGLRLPWEV